MPATPKRSGRAPVEGARFFSEVLATNARDARVLARLSQDDVADRMRELGHARWSRATVSEVEREGRSVAVLELLSLCLVLDQAVGDLLDPAGIDGRAAAPVDLGPTVGPHLGLVTPDTARAWVEGRIRIGVSFDDANERVTDVHVAEPARDRLAGYEFKGYKS